MNFIYKGLFCGLSSLLFLHFNKNNKILSFIIYQTMFYYSYIEINIKKKFDLIYNIPIVKKGIYKIQYYMFNEVELVKSNFVFSTCKLTEVIRYNPNYFDFYIFTDHTTSNKIVSKDVMNTLNVEKCDFKFYVINVKIPNVDLIDDEKTFSIDFDNYYMVNNVINKYLICFLIYKQYNVYLDPETVTYIIEFMDNNMNYKTITEKEEIILKKENYLFDSKHNDKCDSIFHSDEKISNNMFKTNNEDYFIEDDLDEFKY